MTRNPFGVEDVPGPDGDDVAAFAAEARLTGAADDPNASDWSDVRAESRTSIRGHWSSRWNVDGLDWQVGNGELRLAEKGRRVFILFDWDDGAQQGLIEATRADGDRLVGRYLNLNRPEITRPWVGLVVDTDRIDGEHSGGRIDFRRAFDSEAPDRMKESGPQLVQRSAEPQIVVTNS
jgi:hypothetical protein